MGGKAFASGPRPLYTPRMAPRIYTHMRALYHARLRELFCVVATPLDGAGKQDFGDIDIVVTWPVLEFSHAADGDDIVEKLSKALGAHDAQRNGTELHFAVPWPTEIEGTYKVTDKTTDTKEADEVSAVIGEKADRFVQVDVHICDDLPTQQWMLFRNSHGDFWNILGAIMRRHGLMVDTSGLQLMIPEIERIHKKRAKVFLTNDAAEALSFLGFGARDREWEEPFESLESVFGYLATCRLFSPDIFAKPSQIGGEKRSTDSSDGKKDQDESEKAPTDEKLNSKARKTMRDRPMYRQWIEEWLPAHKLAVENSITVPRTPVSPETVRQEAFARFPAAEREYRGRLLSFRKEQQERNLFRDVIKAAIPMPGSPEANANAPGNSLSQNWFDCVGSALKRIIMKDDSSLGIVPSPPLRDLKTGLFLEEEVKNFVVRNWQEVGERAWDENKRRLRERNKRTASKNATGETHGMACEAAEQRGRGSEGEPREKGTRRNSRGAKRSAPELEMVKMV